MHFILILNDGTDEIFNLNGAEVENKLQLKEYLEDMFQDEDDDENIDPQHFLYLAVENLEKLNYWLELSNGMNRTEEETQTLLLLRNRFQSYDQLTL